MSTRQAHKNRVLGFFQNEIDKYLVGDLTRLSEIHPDRKTGLRGCTIPQALLVFSIIDLLGFLINEDPNARKEATASNYKALFSSKQQLFPREYEAEADKIIKLFRHGITHQVFPKASGIAKLPNDSRLIIDGVVPCLNADKITRDLLGAIKRLTVKIENEESGELVERMNDRLNKLASDDFLQLSKLL